MLYAIHQHSEKRRDIHCKVTFGFKYMFTVTIDVEMSTDITYLAVGIVTPTYIYHAKYENTHTGKRIYLGKGEGAMLKNTFPIFYMFNNKNYHFTPKPIPSAV